MMPDDRFIESARTAYSRHVIRYRHEATVRGSGSPTRMSTTRGMWTVGEPGTSNLLSDVVVGLHLIITGDITGDGPDLIVRGGPGNAMARLRWFASSSLDYLAEKVVASRHSEISCGWDWDAELAREQLKADLDEEGPELFAEFEAMHPDAFDDVRSFWRALTSVDRLEDCRYGEHPSLELALARELVRRLVQLLDEEGGG